MVCTRRAHGHSYNRRPGRRDAGQLYGEESRHRGRTERTGGDDAEASADVAPREARPPRHIQDRHAHQSGRHREGLYGKRQRQVGARAISARDQD